MLRSVLPTTPPIHFLSGYRYEYHSNHNLILNLVAAVIRMVRLEDVQGRVYTLKSKSACCASGILTPVDPDVVRGHMVLVLDVVPEKRDHVKIMTVSVKWSDYHLLTPLDYLDFEERRRLCSYLPNTKKGFAIQLRLRNHLGLNHREIVLFITTLPTKSSHISKISASTTN